MFEVIRKADSKYLGFHEDQRRAMLTIAFPDMSGESFEEQQKLSWPYLQEHSGYLNGVKEAYSIEFSELRVAKEAKKKEIREAWEKEFTSGKMLSSLGFTIDNRRQGKDNDLQNIQNLKDMGLTEIWDADDITQEMTPEKFITLIAEMQLDGAMKYQNKKTLIALVEAAETVEAIEIISWSS